MDMGGDMNKMRWKIGFFIIACFVISTIYDAFTVADIIAPTHPLFLSILMLVADLLILFGAYCCAFDKFIIRSKAIWFAVIILFFTLNGIALIYEFINNHDGYEVYDMVTMTISYLLLALFLVLPIIKHIEDLDQISSNPDIDANLP